MVMAVVQIGMGSLLKVAGFVGWVGFVESTMWKGVSSVEKMVA